MSADPYLYPGTDVLINKRHIKDADELRRFEYSMAAIGTPDAVAYASSRKAVDERAWRGVHRRLFQDVYPWAGKYRTVSLAKGTTAFAPLRVVASGYADKQIFPAFRQAVRAGQGVKERVIDALAECWGELNYLHPFREGNGRSTQIIVAELARRNGWAIDWRSVDQQEEIAAARAATETQYRPHAVLLDRAFEPLKRD